MVGQRFEQSNWHDFGTIVEVELRNKVGFLDLVSEKIAETTQIGIGCRGRYNVI